MRAQTPIRRIPSLIGLTALSALSSALLIAADSGDPPKTGSGMTRSGGTIQRVTLKDGRSLDGILHDDGTFTLYDLKTGKVLATLQVAADSVVSSVDEPLDSSPANAGDEHPSMVAPGATSATPAGDHGPGLAGRWSIYFQPAQSSARKTGRPLLMLFTDSDSQPGRIFASTVLDDINFKAWTRNYTVLFQTDAAAARKKTPNPALVKQDDDLAKHFAVSERPLVVMLDAAGKELARQGFTHGQADDWMTEIQEKLSAHYAATTSATSAATSSASAAAATASADPAPAAPAPVATDPAQPTAPPPQTIVHNVQAPPPAATPPPVAPVPTAGGAPPPLGGGGGTVDNLRAWRDAGKPKPDDN